MLYALIAVHKCQGSRRDSSETRLQEFARLLSFLLLLARLSFAPNRPRVLRCAATDLKVPFLVKDLILPVVDFETTDTRCRVRSRRAQERACEMRNKRRVHSAVQSRIKRDWISANKPTAWPSFSLIRQRASLCSRCGHLSMIRPRISARSSEETEAASPACMSYRILIIVCYRDLVSRADFSFNNTDNSADLFRLRRRISKLTSLRSLRISSYCITPSVYRTVLIQHACRALVARVNVVSS